MLKEVFFILFSNYCKDSKYIASLWLDVKNAHTQSNRYYHNLTHLEHLYQNLLLVREKINDWDMILFATFYHDYVYNVHKKNNEEQSAKKAETVLYYLKFDKARVDFGVDMIKETKSHTVSPQSDINYFTDADLSILGCDWELYQEYMNNVRREYNFYPDFMYKKGRIKVLNHFLAMQQIFKTNDFFEHFETQARSNIQKEIDYFSK